MRQYLVPLLLALAVFAIYGKVVDEDNPKKWKTRDHSTTAARDKLLDELFTNYKEYNYPENSTVKFGISILSVDFDEKHDIMNTNGWLRYVWSDNRLKWDSEATGISILRVPSSKVWLPDIALYNGVKPKMECWDSNVLIFSTGKVLWVPPCHLQSYCNLTLSQHEDQICTLKFGSWTFDGFTMGLDFYDDKQYAAVDDFMGHKYVVTKNEATKNEKVYECCAEPYIDIKYTLGFKRQTPMTCRN